MGKVFYTLPRGRNSCVAGLGFKALKSNPIWSLLLALVLPQVLVLPQLLWPCLALQGPISFPDVLWHL